MEKQNDTITWLRIIHINMRDSDEISKGQKLKALEKAIERMETETMPVIHAKWIDSTPNYVNGYYGNSYYCSACKYYYSDSPKEMLYCPHCGAKMDESEENGTDEE